MTIAGLSQHLKPFYRKVKHGNTSLARDQGTVFIDGDDFALRLTATGHYTLRSDWGGICKRVDEFMSCWKDWDIGAIIFDGQGPEIDRVVSQQEVDDQMRFMSRFPFLGGRPNSVSAVVYDYLRERYPQLNVVSTPSALKMEILASTVYQYARQNRSQKVFLLGKDNRYAAFQWPENVYLCKIHALPHDWEVSMLYPPQLLSRRPRLHCFELAFLCMERFVGNKTFKQIKKWLKKNEKYHKWRQYQQNILDTSYKLVRTYKHINLETDSFEVQRALNHIRNTNMLYKQMPLLCEPFWAESAWLAGRSWRSVAYEMLMDRVQYVADKRMHFMEGRRDGCTIALTKIPVSDKYREKESEVYPSMANMMNRLQKVSMKGLKRQIMSEIFTYTTSQNVDTRLDYEEAAYRKLMEVYMLQIWANKKTTISEKPDLTYRQLKWDDRSMYLNPTCLRVYNKLYACVYSLILLQSFVKLPYHFTMADLDSILWIKLWKKHVGEPYMTRKELADIADPAHLTDQFYSYSSENRLRRKLNEARQKCLKWGFEGDEAGVVEAEAEVVEAENGLVEGELDHQERLQKAPVTALLLMTEYKQLVEDLKVADEVPTPRFNLRLLKGRLERVCGLLKDEHFELVRSTDSGYEWLQGKKEVAIELDRKARLKQQEEEEKKRQREEEEREEERRKRARLEGEGEEGVEEVTTGEEGEGTTGEDEAEEVDQEVEAEEAEVEIVEIEDSDNLSLSEEEDYDVEFGGYDENDAEEGDMEEEV
ncbi:hypothetical protein CJU90_1607 [Yarrowia sp. C11]|nr:hypothetical protein CKK34_0331 [Yarrowia sp. E02]KAG5371568.1 hypothetical protein CJU90_1607 [Yarrowia sp. C11]